MDASVREDVGMPLAHAHLLLSGEIRPYLRMRIRLNLPYAACGNHAAALLSGLRAELDHIVGMPEHLRIVVHEHHRVAVVHEVIHHPQKPLEVRRVHSYRGFVEHVQYARGPVAHRAGELHSLAFSCRKRGSGAVEAQVTQSEFHQPRGHPVEFLDHVLGHRPHLHGELWRQGVHP